MGTLDMMQRMTAFQPFRPSPPATTTTAMGHLSLLVRGSGTSSPTSTFRLALPVTGRTRGGQSFNRTKHCRRIATRYDKLAKNFPAFIKLAAIRLWLRVYESTP